MKTKEIEYRAGDILSRGFVAYPEKEKESLPCVMIAHDWSGRSERHIEKAKQLANMGFVGFAIDMYGEAKTGKTTEENQALVTPLLENRALVATRVQAAFKAAASLPLVDTTNIAAIGYCFGGLCVLDLARTGTDMKGVVSFHGLLMAPPGEEAKDIHAKVLVLHGYDDPMVPPDQVLQFAREMTEKKADWQIHMYGHTKHSFTNPGANDDAMGTMYNKTADCRSWKSAKDFFAEIFSS